MPAYRWPWIALTFGYCAVIFWASSRSDLGLDPPPWLDWPHSDKLIHLILFGGLSGLVALGLWRSNGPALPPARQLLGAAGFATLYGVTDEIHQRFVPGRSFDPLDLLADAAGAILIAGVFTIWTARRASRATQPRRPLQG